MPWYKFSSTLFRPFVVIASLCKGSKWSRAQDNDSEKKSEENNYILVCTTEGEYRIKEKPQPKKTKSPIRVTSPVRVCRIQGGFTFPISDGREVRRLEQFVTDRDDIRQEYVKVLSRKPRSTKIANFVPYMFSDEALEGYSFNGVNVLGRNKIAMRGYNIFNSCFLDAYENEELTLEELAAEMTMAVKQSRNRMRQRTFRAKKSIKKMLKEKSEN